MRPILFLVSSASGYRLLKYVAEHLAHEGRPVSFLYERGPDALLAEIERDAKALGAAAYSLEALTDPRSQSGPVWRRHPRLMDAIAMWARVVFSRNGPDVIRLKKLREILASQLAAARRLLAMLRPAAIVSGEDGISAPLAVHAAARHAGVPVVVVPFGYGVRRDLETALEVKAAHGGMITATGRRAGLIRRFAPQWIKSGRHAGALMYEEDYIVAAESLGITLRDPWMIHGGYADRLCVESDQMLDVYRSEGLPESKLAITGTPYCDVMVRALDANPAAKAALRQPRRITADITRILVSWPPSYHGDRGAFSEFPTYREMSAVILMWLARLPGCRVTVSLHPATPASDRTALIESGVHLTDEYVIGQIPLHDVFVTYFSSTIRWAIAAGKPVINFDLYKLDLKVFDSAPGVRRVASFAEFQAAMTQLTTSDAAFAEAAERQIAVAPRWGTLDGMSTARIAREIEQLAN